MQKIYQVLKQLKEKGHRNSNIRNEILSSILKSKTPLSYFDIQKKLFNKKINTNKTTIYRELSLLKKQNIIRELQFKSEAKYYEIMPDNHHHHLVCTNCNTIDHVELKADLDLEEKRIAKKNKFKILNHSLEFYGLCKNCHINIK